MVVLIIIIIIIIIVIFIIAGRPIIVCLNKSHRLYVLICADVISTTLAVCSARQVTCITTTPLVCTWRSWLVAASNTLQNWRWWSTCDWGQDIMVKLPTILSHVNIRGAAWSAALQIRPCRGARLMCCTAASSVGGRLFILGGSFFLLILNTSDRQEMSSLFLRTVSTGRKGLLQSMLFLLWPQDSQISWELLQNSEPSWLLLFFAKGVWNTVTPRECMGCQQVQTLLSQLVSSCLDISDLISSSSHVQTSSWSSRKKQQQYENVCVICVYMWVLPCWISSRRSLMITTSAFSWMDVWTSLSY